MNTSIYISNNELQVVAGEAGSRGVRFSYAATLNIKGAVLNGVITDEGILKNALTALRDAHPEISFKSVTLTLGSSLIYSKRAQLPALPDKRQIRVVENEIGLLEEGEELVYDYAVLKKDKSSSSVLLTALKSDVIDSYLTLFSSLGMKVSRINTMVNSEIKLLRACRELTGKTFVLIVIDGVYANASLYVNGEFRLSNRVRLFAEPGMEAYATELLSLASSMIQFAYAEKNRAEVQDLLLVGGGEELMAALREALSLPVSPLALSELMGGERHMEEYLYALGSLFAAGRDINLAARRKSGRKEKNPAVRRALAYLPLGALALVLLLVYLLVNAGKLQKEAELNALKAYTHDPAVLAEYAEALSVIEIRNQLADYLSALTTKQEAASHSAEIGGELIAALLSRMGDKLTVTSYAYTAENSTLVFKASASSQLSIPELVQQLRDTGLFSDVNYNGYSSAVDGYYHCTIECVLLNQ